ncbi:MULTISPECIES: hypothetical protein [unclassified Streptomyces]|uniref:hypothetical protein n=1 Tax=unclassified Streptomyces TaxID=2593676 RepID=UPI0007C995CA|nr:MULTISPECIES: hypothetical protein [unclassified Streptomyces]
MPAPQGEVVDPDHPDRAGISATKRTALSNGADALNTVIRNEVAQHGGFVYEDAADRFTGHQLCDATPWLHALNWPIGQSFHPNAAGQSSAYLPALRTAVPPEPRRPLMRCVRGTR